MSAPNRVSSVDPFQESTLNGSPPPFDSLKSAESKVKELAISTLAAGSNISSSLQPLRERADVLTSSVESNGETRLNALDASLFDRNIIIPFSYKERLLLLSIFESLKNPTIDNLPLFLILSINRDFINAISDLEKLGASQQVALLKKEQLAFNVSSLSFVHKVETEYFLNNHKINNPVFEKDVIRGFDKRLSTTCACLFEKLDDRVSSKGALIAKYRLWSQLLKHKDYKTISSIQFTSEALRKERRGQEVAHSRLQQGDFSLIQAQNPISTSTTIDQGIRNCLLPDDEMIELLILYLEVLSSFNENQSELLENYGVFLKSIQEQLKQIKFQSSDQQNSTRKVLIQELGRMLQRIEINSEKSKTIIQVLFQCLKITNDEQSTLNEIVSRAREYTSLGIYRLDLKRIYVTLNDLMNNKSLFFVAHRLYSNFDAYFNIHGKLRELGKKNLKMLSSFEGLLSAVIGDKDQFDLKIKEYLMHHPSFRDLETPGSLQLHCELNHGKRDISLCLPAFLEVRKKYLEQVDALLNSDKMQEVEQLKKDYSSFCMALVPALLCIGDINNLIGNDFDEHNSILIPDSILECFDLDEEEISPDISSSAPEEAGDKGDLVSSSVPLDSSEIGANQISHSSLSREDSLQHVASSPQAAPVPNNPSSTILVLEKFKIRRGEKVRKWRDRIKEIYHLILREGGRHTQLVTEDNKMVTVTSRGSRPHTSRRIASKIAKQVNETLPMK